MVVEGAGMGWKAPGLGGASSSGQSGTFSVSRELSDCIRAFVGMKASKPPHIDTICARGWSTSGAGLTSARTEYAKGDGRVRVFLFRVSFLHRETSSMPRSYIECI